MEILFLFVGIIVGCIITFFILKFKFEKDKGVPREDYESLNLQFSQQSINAKVLEEKVRSLSELSFSVNTELQKERDCVVDLVQKLSTKEADFRNLEEKLTQQKEDLEQLQVHFTLEFKNIANSILEEKSQKFTEQNKSNIDEILKPHNEKIKDFQKKVEETYDKESKERFSLHREIKSLVDLNQSLQKEASNLTNALKGQSKTMGNWGEIILESILEKSGLAKDREYFLQQTFKDDNNRQYRPDVIVKLPGGRDIVIDSKVSLVAYENYCSEEDKDKQSKYLKEHLQSIKNHINGLASKNYQDLYDIQSLDYVLMFMPIEPAYMLALQTDFELWSYAYEKRIVLISPSNLIVILKLTANMWRHESQNKNAIEIAKKSGELYDKFVSFLEDLKSLRGKLSAATSYYDDCLKKLYEGRGSVIKRVEELKVLGAKASKSIPQEILDKTED